MEKLAVIIILNYNKKEDTLKCLNSVSKLGYPSLEIILVDNGSNDGSADAVKANYPDVHLIESRINAGASGGRNLGIKYADEYFNYDYLLFLDNDITIEADALSEMIKSFCSDENIGIVSPKCYVMDSPRIIKYAGGIYINFFTGSISDYGGGIRDEGQFDHEKIIPACGGLCLVRKDLLDKVGHFDDKFNPYGWEDVDFSLRAGKLGYKILYNPKAVIYHKGGKIGRGRAIREYEYSKVKNFFYFFRKHANIFQLSIIYLILPFRFLLIACKEIYLGEFNIILSQVHGFLSLFKPKFE